jgi:hypothetical protein
MSLFSSFSDFTKHRQAAAEEETHAAKIDQFKLKLKELEHLGQELHASGHYIDIHYEHGDVARHNPKGLGSTLFFNRHLGARRSLSITKNPIPKNPFHK